MRQDITNRSVVGKPVPASIGLSQKGDRHDRHKQSDKLVHISPSLAALRLPGTPPVSLYLISRNSYARRKRAVESLVPELRVLSVSREE